MRFVGITGGMGAGKSTVLDYIQEAYRAYIVKSDELARGLMEPGGVCYDRIRDAFSDENIIAPDGSIDRGSLAGLVFHDPKKLKKLNDIVHPAVRKEIGRVYDRIRQDGQYDYFILEAALLIEEHYDEVCDELWYIYANEDVRRKRLKASRGYSDARIDAVFASQLPDEVFRQKCRYVIDNSGSPEETYAQIRSILG